ncbi:MAG: hypothetical protein ACM3QZ_02450 [Solirubrobacterales bacterium]
MKIRRLIEANFNRAREGLRVVEDVFRFILDDAELCAEAKEIRLTLGNLEARLEREADLTAARDTAGDVGTHHTPKAEQTRDDYRDVVRANFKRTEEALRVLEEMLKLLDTCGSETCKGLRYQVYELESLAFNTMKERKMES